MHKGIDDTEKQRLRTNYLRNGENIINVGNSSLLPNLDLWSISGGLLVESIITPTGINMTELLTYIDPKMEYSERNENFTAFDKVERYHTQMRVCKKSDFESRGFFTDS